MKSNTYKFVVTKIDNLKFAEVREVYVETYQEALNFIRMLYPEENGYRTNYIDK